MGYSDRPFDFAYLWLDYAGFSGLLDGHLPYAERTARSDMRERSLELESLAQKLNDAISSWPFGGALELKELIRPDDYGNSITIHASAKGFSQDQIHVATRVMRAGARQEIILPLAGPRSLLQRVAESLQSWRPPETLIDRPLKEGARQRFAARLLDRWIRSLGGEWPASARIRFIAELLEALGELGKWDEVAWADERVRRCLDGKARKRK